MKKVFSKKTGFTLVEILVAFVIFAIMSSMILAIMRLAIAARASNNTYARELAEQKEALVREDKETVYDATGVTDKFTLPFSDGTNTVNVDIDYEVKAADENAEFVEEGLNYFVPNVTKKDSEPEDDNTTGGGGTQASRYDTRLTGSKGFDEIRVTAVKKFIEPDPDNPILPAGTVRYIIKLRISANTDILDSTKMAYAQCKMYFKDTSVTTTEEIVNPDDNKTYIRTKYGEANILGSGYVKDNVTNYEFFSNRSDSGNDYLITTLRNGGVQISYDYRGGGKQKFEDTGSEVCFYVDFDKDIAITESSFGSNAENVEGYAQKIYHEYVDSKGNHMPNIYGAYPFTEVLKP